MWSVRNRWRVGYKIAEQFGINVWPTRAGLVPFTLMPEDKARLAPLSGIAVDSIVSTVDMSQSFHEKCYLRIVA